MTRYFIGLMLLLSLVLTGCSSEMADSEKVEAEDTKKTTKSDSTESSQDKPDSTSSTTSVSTGTEEEEEVVEEVVEEDSSSNEFDFYMSTTKKEMDFILSEMETLWKVHLIDETPEKVFDEAWSTTLVDSLYILLERYEDLIEFTEEMETKELGKYEEYALDFKFAIYTSIEARVDAIDTLLKASETDGGIIHYMDEYNEHVDKAMVYQRQAEIKQEDLEWWANY